MTKSKQANSKANVRSTAKGMIVKHTEYCGVVDNTTSRAASYDASSGRKTAAEPLRLPLNPGDGTTFPWLTGIAARFEKYKFRALRFRYVPASSTYYTGSVSMCPIYDPSESIPSDRRALYNADGAKLSAVYQPLTLMIPGERLRETKYVRLEHSETIGDNELRLSDLGFMAIALLDVGENNNVVTNTLPHSYGNLFVDYEVELISPRVGKKVHKSAHYAHNSLAHSVLANTLPSLFGNYPNSDRRTWGEGDAYGHNVHSTLGMKHEFQGSGVYSDPTGTKNVEYSGFKLQEPFTGLLEITHDSSTAAIPYDPIITVNGNTDSGFEGLWDVGSGDHPIKHPIVKFIKRVGNGVSKAVSTFKIIADAGETVAIGLANAIDFVGGTAEALWTECDPELLELAGLV